MSVRSGGTQFIARQLTVAIFVQSLESRDSIGDLRGIQDTVMVGIERRHDRGFGRPSVRMTFGAISWRTVMRRTSAVWAIRRSTGWAAIGRAACRAAIGCTIRTGWAQLVLGQLSVTVLVEGLEDGYGVGDFRGINDAVMVGVQCQDDRGRRTMMSAGPVRGWVALGRGILGHERQAGHAKGREGEK